MCSEIQQWCNETLQAHGKSSCVGSFKDKDLSLAVVDLCDVISPGSVDYALVHSPQGDFTPPEPRMRNLEMNPFKWFYIIYRNNSKKSSNC